MKRADDSRGTASRRHGAGVLLVLGLLALLPGPAGAQRVGWLHPAATSNDLQDVWAAAANDLYAVGTAGTIARFDGAGWRVLDSGTDADLFGVFGTSASNVYAVGANGTVLHYDGSSWSREATPVQTRLHDVWVAPGGQAFAVGEDGTVLQRSGGRWTAAVLQTTADLYCVWGSSARNVHAGGGPQGSGAGTISTWLRYDGSVWSVSNTLTNGSPRAMWGSSATSVWAVDDFGQAHRFDGAHWLYNLETGIRNQLQGLWGIAPDRLYAAGSGGKLYHYDGDDWAELASPTTQTLGGLGGAGAAPLWAVGNAGTVLRWDGGQWRAIAPLSTARLRGVWGSAEGQVEAAGANTILSATGPVVKADAVQAPFAFELTSIGGVAPQGLLAVGTSGAMFRRDGAAWIGIGIAGNSFFGAFGLAADRIYVAGVAGVSVYDGEGLTSLGLRDPQTGQPLSVQGVWADAAQNVYACGYGSLHHFDGLDWTTLGAGATHGQTLFNALWGAGPSEVFLVGGGAGSGGPCFGTGTILRYGGSGFVDQTPGVVPPLHGVWARTGDDVYAVGCQGTILHYDGARWSRVPSGTSRHLFDVFGRSENQVWVAGDSGTLLELQPAEPVAAVPPGVYVLLAAGGALGLFAVQRRRGFPAALRTTTGARA
jgi:hypothetical protein